MGQRFRLSNNQAAFLVLMLLVFELVSIAGFLQYLSRPTPSSLAVGQVLTVVQNSPPFNYYFNATAANDVYGGTPGYNLDFGQDVVLKGEESDANGVGDVGGSTCAWDSTGFSYTNYVSFTTCNSTDCNYTCSLTLSSSTPSGFYNVTSRILDGAGLNSDLNQTIYVFPFSVPSPTAAPTAQRQGGNTGYEVLILRPAPPLPAPTATPSPLPSAFPTPSPSPAPAAFQLRLVIPDYINKCEVKNAIAFVENDNPEAKTVVLDFEGKENTLRLLPFESKAVSFHIKAPRASGEEVFLVQASLYSQGNKVAEAEKYVKLLWRGLDVCVTELPAKEFVFIAGRKSVAKVSLEAASGLGNETLEAEASKGGNSVFLDLAELKGHYYEASFYVFEKGDYDVKVRLRKGFQTIEENVEKATIR